MYKSVFSNVLIFLIGEHSYNKMVSISVYYFSVSRCMPIFILVGKVVLLVCIKSPLIISFPARTINKAPFKFFTRIICFDYKGHIRFSSRSESSFKELLINAINNYLLLALKLNQVFNSMHR